ncbi:unnamed protein product, partial [Hymenolepis diminuta]
MGPDYADSRFAKNEFRSLFTQRYSKARADYERNLIDRSAKMQEIVNNERRLIDEVALMRAKTHKQHRNMLLAKLEEVRRLKEAELRKLAEAGYRKQTTCNRVIY